MRYLFFLLLPVLTLIACRQTTAPAVEFVENKENLPPNERWGELFEAVQMAGVFPDGKTFVDCVPLYPTDQILAAYSSRKDDPEFHLRAFVLQHFQVPGSPGADFQTNTSLGVSDHIRRLWPVLTRPADTASRGSLIPLPNPYVVPGGRFREVYYWDSYFTMLGLQVDGELDLIENMVDNFAYLIDTIGFIPNGNRTYYLTRSQPPFFASMVSLLAEIRDSQVLVQYLPELQAEYDFWMEGENELSPDNPAVNHVVRLTDGVVLNRYYDQGDYPRAESYREDVETAKAAGGDPATVYRHLRAGAASGWDYSSRWLADQQNLSTIHTTDIIPVDLNALLYDMELTLAAAYERSGEQERADRLLARAAQRLAAVQQYCWDEGTGFFRDYDFVARGFTPVLSLAGVYPLSFRMARPEQAARVASLLEKDFLQPGGLLSTPNHTGQQWDAPNGWAPLQWLAYQGLKNYGIDDLANLIRDRWIANCIRVYENTGKLVEKYNVEDLTLEAGGGEYPVQDGFGWTNGVLQRFILESQE
jgi:alpha,alpha-trehalase